MGNDESTPGIPQHSQAPTPIGMTFPESGQSAAPGGAPAAGTFGAAASFAAESSVAPAADGTVTRPPPLPARPQPLPVQPLPVQPITDHGVPPALPSRFAPQGTLVTMAAPPLPPVYGYPPAPPPPTRSSWGRWGLPLFAVWFMLLLAGGALAFYKSSRLGAPRRASAAAPAFRPAYPRISAAPSGAAAGKPGTRAADPFADPASALKTNNPPTRPPRPLTVALPLSSLPRDREMDRELKRVYEACEGGGLRVASVKTLKSTRSGAVTIQPVRVSLEGSYESLTKLMRHMHQSFPHVAIEAVEMARPRGGTSAADGPAQVPAELSLVWRLRSDAPANGSEGYDDAPPIPQPDLAPALGLLAAGATDRVMFTTVSIQAAGRGKPGLQGRVGGIATSDAEVAHFLQEINRAKSLADVNLLTVDASAYGSQPVRKFAVTFRPTSDGEDISVSKGSSGGDPFRPTTTLKSSAGAPADGTARVTPNAQLHTEARAAAARAAQRLHLQAIMSGNGTRSCMINNRLVREGDTIDGFVVESVADSSAVIRQGKFRFELNVPK